MWAVLLVLLTAGGSAWAEEPAAPVLIEDVVPEYPPAARDQGLEGLVVIQVAVLEDGTVGDAAVVQGPHPLLERAALEAARRLRFEPARQDGQPVAVEILYRFQFDLGLADEQGVAVPGSLQGVVQDPDGLPILDAAITLRSLEDPDFPAIAATTRADGRFRASFLPSGAYHVHLEHPDFHFTDAEVEISAGQNLRRVFTLVPADVYQVVVFYDQRTWREVERGALEPDEGTVTGSYVLTRRDIEVNPGSLEDAARAVHNLPG
ncbi:MAG: TonB family protein, partial [Deltaproteobacteria bacterium]|nr:TonB family protein [Deltaproteobacteria bacterium]